MSVKINPEIFETLENMDADNNDMEMIRKILGYEIQSNSSGVNSRDVQNRIMDDIDKMELDEETINKNREKIYL